MNKLIITGRVGRTPETRTISTGDTVCSFSVAVDNRRKGGEEQPPTWFRCSAWGKLGENCQRYLDKGKLCAVVGSVSVSVYTPKDGGETRATMEIRADEVEFLSAKDSSGSENPNNSQRKQPAGETVVSDDDFPWS